MFVVIIGVGTLSIPKTSEAAWRIRVGVGFGNGGINGGYIGGNYNNGYYNDYYRYNRGYDNYYNHRMNNYYNHSPYERDMYFRDYRCYDYC